MQHTIPTDPYLSGDLIGFTAGFVITLLLLGLTIRALRLPGTPIANISFALSALAWNAGGLAGALLLVAGTGREDGWVRVAWAVQFSGAAFWPVAMLAIWRPFAVLRWQRMVFRGLQVASPVSGALIVLAVWWHAATGVTIVDPVVPKHFAAFNASILGVAAVLALKGFSLGRVEGRSAWAGMRFSSIVILAGILGITIAILIQHTFALSEPLRIAFEVVIHQSPLLILLGAFFHFARFRFADLFIRHTLRILLATTAAVLLVLAWRAEIVSTLAALTAFPRATQLFIGSLLAAALVLSFAHVDRHLGTLVDRWIVRLPDYRQATRQLKETLDRLHAESDIVRAVEEAARSTLELEAVGRMPIERLPSSLLPPEVADGEIVELDGADPLRGVLALPTAELLVPVRTAGRVTSVLVVSPGQERRGLVTHEVAFLRTVAGHLGSRLDARQLEQEMVERQSRETVLLQQLTEAELRALRAQINPHFLFNSLNTIADLIVTDPTSAEAMTLRLAKVFRYVLTHTSRPLTSIREEIDFLRAYLQIEEARFNGRLRVQIDVPPELAQTEIPSLIMQPLVENSLKHGLAPKLGPGHLWISARSEGDTVCLNVEDDGVGLSVLPGERMHGTGVVEVHVPRGRSSPGVGLANVAQRLTVLYDERARVSVEPRQAGGTRVSIHVPRAREVTSFAGDHLLAGPRCAGPDIS